MGIDNISDIDAAYLAGFIDGDGCIKISKRTRGFNHPQYDLQVDISNDALSVLNEFKSLSNLGNISSSEGGTFKKAIRHRWILCGWEATLLLERILPYLRIKQSEAELGIAFQSMRPGKGSKARTQLQRDIDDILYNKCRELKKEIS